MPPRSSTRTPIVSALRRRNSVSAACKLPNAKQILFKEIKLACELTSELELKVGDEVGARKQC
jgi:hypothetical protein